MEFDHADSGQGTGPSDNMQPFEAEIRPKNYAVATHSAAGESDHEKNAAWGFDAVLAAICARGNGEESAKGPAKARETCAVSRVNNTDCRYLEEPAGEMPQRVDYAGFSEIRLHARSGRLAWQLQVHDVQAGRAGRVRDDDAHAEQCREGRLRIH